ncbi:MAG: adenylate/guanylate cyclase domain-containing protein [Alphaproteobacteria bacterium]|nr:adenylate/guanylate cyclase domain-containing protein [Alphaproteobacteria bacterium]
MMYRSSTAPLIACLAALLVLLLAAAAMTLNLGGIASALGGLQYDAFARLAPNVAATSPGELTTTAFSQIGSGEGWENAQVLWPQLLFLLIGGGLVLLLFARGHAGLAGLLTILAVAIAVAGAWGLYVRGGLFLDALSPSLALALAFASGVLVEAAARPRSLRTARVVANGADAVVADPAPVVAPPARVRVPVASRTVTYLCCVLRGLPAAGAANRPDGAALATLIDSALSPAMQVVTQHRGTVVSLAGDRFAAVWNASEDDAEHALHACEAALRMTNALTLLKDQHGEGTPYDPLRIGIGIATGPAFAGSILEGPDDYSVVGDCVDVADRLCGLGERYGPLILVDEATRSAADADLALLEVDTIAGGADQRAARIYALYGNPLVRASPKFRALATFHEHLFGAIRARRWSDARTLLDQCGDLSGAIPQLYRLHAARVDWLESHPPPDDWDGVVRSPVP